MITKKGGNVAMVWVDYKSLMIWSFSPGIYIS